ncbi:MAG: hypothetical protein ACRECJ_03260, partial [Limisphaerales bacterium]
MKIKRKLLISAAFIFAFLPNVYSNQLEEIPLDSWVYPVIDELHFQGFLPNLFVADKPYTRGEIFAYLATVKQGLDDGTLNLKPHQRWLFERLFDEFKLELASKENQNESAPPLTFRWGSAFNLKSD